MLQITLTRKGLTNRKLRKLNGFMKLALRLTMKRWRGDILPEHFKRGAGNKYKYQRRTTAYAKRKRRRGLPPLVWSGAARDIILGDRREPTGSAKRMLLKMKAPGFFGYKYKRPKTGGQWKHTMADEVKKMTQAEVQTSAERVGGIVGDLMTRVDDIDKVIYNPRSKGLR